MRYITKAVNSNDTWASKPFPIGIHINIHDVDSKNDFDADPFNLDPKAVRRIVSNWV